VTKSFSPATVTTGQTTRLTLTISSTNPDQAMSALAITDAYPAALKNSASPSPTTTCGGTAAGAAGGSSLTLTGGALAAGGTCTVSVNVVATASGTHQNVIATGGSTATISTRTVSSVAPAQATLTVSAPLTATKSVMTYFDPINGMANPKAVPGSIVAYTITVTNPGTIATDTDTVFLSDAVPTGTKLYVADASGAGTGPVVFAQGTPSSALSYAFTSLGSTTDDVSFSKDGGANYDYTPTPDADGADAAVTHIRVKPRGAHAPGGSFNISFAVRLP
jgi:uncharacterized repeat protein (TIGR01451 family)